MDALTAKAECLGRRGREADRRLERGRSLGYDRPTMEKRALLLDGGLDDGAVTRAAAAAAADVLGGEDWQVTHLALREIEIAPCRGCFGCWVYSPGVCVIDDAGRDVARRAAQSDLLVFLTPVTFGAYSSELKKAIDRLIPNILPFFRRVRGEVHHVKRYARPARLLAIGVSASGSVDPDEEELFEKVVSRNAINFHAPVHRICVLGSQQDDAVVRRRIEDAVRAVIGR